MLNPLKYSVVCLSMRSVHVLQEEVLPMLSRTAASYYSQWKVEPDKSVDTTHLYIMDYTWPRIYYLCPTPVTHWLCHVFHIGNNRWCWYWSDHMILMYQSYLQEGHFNKKENKATWSFLEDTNSCLPLCGFIHGVSMGALFCVCQTSDQSISTSVFLWAHKSGKENWLEVDELQVGFPPSGLSHHPPFFKVTLEWGLPRTQCRKQHCSGRADSICLQDCRSTNPGRPERHSNEQGLVNWISIRPSWWWLFISGMGEGAISSPSSKYLFLMPFPTTQNDAEG